MKEPTKRDIRLRIPGFRRYGSELETLRARLNKAEQEVRRLRAKRGFAPGADLTADDAEWIAQARKFEFYWANADKKLDPLEMSPFGAEAKEVLRDGRTFLHADRLYTLWQSVADMPDGAAAVAEVGTFKGGSAKLIAKAMRAANRTLPFFVCDTFAGHTKVNKALDGTHRPGRQFRDVQASDVVEYLREFEFLQVVEGDIRETASRISDRGAFGMVHIDVDVHPITEFCLEFFAPRTVTGAMIVVDDYGFTTCQGVKKAVDDFLAARPGLFRAMHLLTGQAVLTRIA
jgi:O-methyltransferase